LFSWTNVIRAVDYLVAPADNVRLQEIMLTYNLKRQWVNKLGLERAQVFIQGNDLYTWYANDFGEDPEYLLGTQNPLPKFTFGVKFDF